MTLITSRSNSKIKFLRSLRQRKGREAAGSFLVEGIRHVGEAVEAGAPLEAIYYAPDLLTSEFARQLIETQEQAGLPCYPLSADVFESVAGRENPQGILAVAHFPQVSLADLNPGNFSWGVAAVSPQDPGNVGTILRTLDAVGASGLLLLDSGVDLAHPTLIRASMGTIFWHPVLRASFTEFQQWAEGHAYTILGTSAHAPLDYREVPAYHRPLVLLLGSEREGLTSAQAQACTRLVRLPMLGRTTSLNLAIAAGVLLYDILERLGE
jgi:TrmH family RNA methyltransferase